MPDGIRLDTARLMDDFVPDPLANRHDEACKPVWKLLVDMSPEELVRCIDFTYMTDVLTPSEAIALLRRTQPSKATREQEMLSQGFPGYTTAAGWLGYRAGNSTASLFHTNSGERDTPSLYKALSAQDHTDSPMSAGPARSRPTPDIYEALSQKHR